MGRSIEERNKDFFGKLAKYYDVLFGNWIRNMQKRVIELVDVVDIKGGARILDAGCGTGNLLVLLEGYGKNFEVYGVDISKEMIDIAGGKVKEAELEVQSVEDLDFRDNFFDYIFSIDAFHHYSDKKLAMDNFYRVLRKNGKLAIVDINFGRFFNKLFGKLEPGNSGIYGLDEMLEMFEDYSFKDIKQNRVGWFSYLTVGVK